MARTKASINNKVKKIKKINERRTEIERAVNSGKLPKEYLDSYESAIRSAVHDNNLINARGNISHGKKAVDQIDTKALDALLKKETSGEAQRKTYQYYQTYRKEEEQLKSKYREYTSTKELETDNPFIEPPSGYDYNQFVQDRDYVYENMETDKDWYQAVKAYFTGVPGRKTYQQLRRANEKWHSLNNKQQKRLLKIAEKKKQAAYFS